MEVGCGGGVTRHYCGRSVLVVASSNLGSTFCRRRVRKNSAIFVDELRHRIPLRFACTVIAILNENLRRHGATIYVITRQHILELFVP